MKTFDLKKEFSSKYWKKFKFHIKFGNTGVARIWINDIKTKYYVSGYGYDKESAVIAKMINDLIGSQDYGNCYTGGIKGKRMLSHGIGFEAVKYAFEYIGGKLEMLYWSKDIYVYEIDFTNLTKGA